MIVSFIDQSENMPIMSWLMFQKDRLFPIIPSSMFQNLALSGKFNELRNGDYSQICIPPLVILLLQTLHADKMPSHAA